MCFKTNWEFCIFVGMNGNSMCLICKQHVSVVKYNTKRHYEANHGKKYKCTGKLLEDKYSELVIEKAAIDVY